MTQVYLLEDIIGKTIKETKYIYNALFLVFEDDTFFALKDDAVGYSQYSLEDRNVKAPMLGELELIVFLGGMTQEQADAYKVDVKQKWEESNKQKEIKLLQELKRKYPDQ